MFRQIGNNFVIFNALFLLMKAVVSGEMNISVDSLESRIVGGVPIPVEKMPTMVIFYNLHAMCSGTIINSWCVMTAAHCFDHNDVVDDMRIEVGASYSQQGNGDMYNVLYFITHNDYNKVMPFACDIALIFVTEEIKLGSSAKRALLVDSQNWMSPQVKNIVVAGWGWTKYGGPVSKLGLMKTFLGFVKSEDCERLHQLSLSPDMFCLYGDGARDTCKGDSGGGVIWNDMVIGIVSHGDGCAKKDKPSVYANVWYFRQWIQSQVENFFLHVCEMLEDREH